MNKLYIVATPIGNLEDITIRAIKVLLEARVIACEDTRRTGQLVKILRERYYDLTPTPLLISGEGNGRREVKYISVRDFNEAKQVEQVILALQTGDVALVSDAGTPLISDPGYKLVKLVRAAGFTVVPIPGPSALTTALCAAGLPTNKVIFWGFFDKKYELDQTATNVFYESPKRVKETIKIIQNKYNNAEIVVANELTKIHEAFLKPEEIGEIKGEITLIVNCGR